MRISALAFCAVAFATSLAFAAPRAIAASPDTPAPHSEPSVPRSEPSFSHSKPAFPHSEPAFPRSEPKASGEIHVVGRYCTPTGCTGAPSPAAQAASFGAAAATILFLARRRRA